MKCFAILLSCLLIATTAFTADNVSKQKKPSSKKVSTPWKPAAFDETAERLPAGYTGVDSRRFYRLIKAKVGRLEKGEFETSEEFAQRTSNKDALLAPINTSDLYAFRIKGINIEYDVDAQVYKTDANYSCRNTDPFWKDKGWVTCSVHSVSYKKDTYVGSNAFGAYRTIERIKGLDFAIALQEDSPMVNAVLVKRPFGGYYDFYDKFAFPVEKARKMKGMEVSVLFVGRVGDAKIVYGRGTESPPTIEAPYDTNIMEEAVPFEIKKIVFYVIKTGEILHQKGPVNHFV